MNWIALSAIAETIGVITLFISVIYLAIQIRQNTQQISSNNEATLLAAFERNIESGNRVREQLFLYPELSELFVKGNKDYSALSDVEKLRFGMLLRNIFSSIQGAFIRFNATKHDPDGFSGSIKIIDDLLKNPGVREYLARSSLDWREEFKKLVDERLQVAVQKSENKLDK